MSDLIEFRHFKYLIAVAEEKNISRAAKRLFLAQPSLSIQLKSIEDALSIELLVRVPKGVKLTPAAEVLIAGARQILALRDEVVAAARASHHGTIAPLRIGFSPFIDCALLQMVCSAHIALFPNCEITPKSGDSVELLSLLERGLIDAVLLPLPAIGIDLNIDKLSRDRLVVCMRSNDPAASLDEIAPSALEKKLKIFREPKQNPEGHRKLMEMLDAVGVHPEVVSTTAHPREIQWMVKLGHGHALIREGSELEEGVVTRPVRVVPAPQIAAGHFSMGEVKSLVQKSHSAFGPPSVEGLYLRRESAGWLEQRAKCVRPEFTQAISDHWSSRPLSRNRILR